MESGTLTLIKPGTMLDGTEVKDAGPDAAPLAAIFMAFTKALISLPL